MTHREETEMRTSARRLCLDSDVPYANRNRFFDDYTVVGDRCGHSQRSEIVRLVGVLLILQPRPLPKVVRVFIAIWKFVVAAWIIGEASLNDPIYGI